MLTFEKLHLWEGLPLKYMVSEFSDGTVAGNCYGKKKSINCIYDHARSRDFLVCSHLHKDSTPNKGPSKLSYMTTCIICLWAWEKALTCAWGLEKPVHFLCFFSFPQTLWRFLDPVPVSDGGKKKITFEIKIPLTFLSLAYSLTQKTKILWLTCRTLLLSVSWFS